MQTLKQLPVPLVSANPTNPNVKTFKSSVNLLQDRHQKIHIIEDTMADIPLPKNNSTAVEILFNYEYDHIPKIKTELICPDEEFEICYYTKQITNKSATIIICNSANIDRTVSISYTVK